MLSRGLADERTHFVKTGSDEYLHIREESKYIVLNISLCLDFVKHPGQVILNTRHGTPLKTLGKRNIKDPFSVCSAQRTMLLSNYLIAPNNLSRDVYLNDYMIHDIMPGKLIMTGYPRNSVFYDVGARTNLRRELGIDDKKTILWMPTWREEGTEKQMEMLLEIDNLAGKLGDKYAIYYKLHPSISKEVPNLKNLKQVQSKYEAYEFLNATDVLITDYSSVYFDYANTARQIILFQYDADRYNAGRGVYPEVKERMPFSIVNTIEELEEAIRFPKTVNVDEFQKDFCPYDNLYAANNCLDILLSSVEECTIPSVDLYVINFKVTSEELLRWKKQINNPQARFVFMPGNRIENLRFKEVECYNQIDYFTYFKNSKLSFKQKITPSQELIVAEQHRLWENLDIANIYAKSGYLPPALSRNQKNGRKN